MEKEKREKIERDLKDQINEPWDGYKEALKFWTEDNTDRSEQLKDVQEKVKSYIYSSEPSKAFFTR